MDLISDLNEPQQQAVQHIDGPLLVLAGAGSGKTRVITRRVGYLIQQGVAPWNILAITFTNKASAEMRERVAELGAPRGATISTFHALCARLLREFAAEAGLSSNYSIYDRDDQIRVVKEAMQRAEVPKERFSPTAIHSMISNAKNDLKTPESYAQDASDYTSRSVAKVYEQYERVLTLNNALDFDDLLLRIAYLLRDRPQVREMLGERYKYVLIDEYQDTNRAQYIIAHGIAGQHRNICATGDPDQSIYAWRGADITNILEFESDYPDAKVVRLEENYRSTQPILTAASNLIANNSDRKEKSLWTRRTDGPEVRVLTCDNERAEAQAIAQAIMKRRSETGEFSGIAIFYRINSLSRVLEETLLNAGIPYRIARGVEFYNRKEVRDALAYLKLIANPQDDVSCLRIINTPTRGIGPTTVKRLRTLADQRGVSLVEACSLTEQSPLGSAAKKRVAAFDKMIREFTKPETLAEPVHKVIEKVIHESGLRASLGTENDEDSSAQANVDELVTAAKEFEQRTGDDANLETYLHEVSLVSDIDHMEGAEGAVTLMTMHAAKGLEFPAVFIVGFEEGVLPFVRQSGNNFGSMRIDPAHLEEERRLAFVGMTRAKNELTLLNARQRTMRGRTQPQAASRFLDEIGQEFVTREDLTSMRTRRRDRRGGMGGGFYADAAVRERIENFEPDPAPFDNFDFDIEAPVPPEYQQLRKGCKVYHHKFGEGTVQKIGSQPWPQTQVQVAFNAVGPKKLRLKQARLEIL